MSVSEDGLQYQRELKVLAKGSAISLLGKVLTKGARILAGPILARLLNVDGFALYCLVDSTITFVTTLLTSPFSVSAVRLIAAEEQTTGGRRALATVAFVGLCGLVVGTGLAAGATWFAPLLARTVFGRPELTPLLRVAVWTLPLIWLGFNLSSACVGRRTVLYQELSDFVYRMGGLVAMVALVVMVGRGASPVGKALWACAGGVLGATGAAAVGLWGARRCFPGLAVRYWRECELRQLMGIAIPFMLMLLADYGVGRVNVVLSSLWLTTADVAIYGAISVLTSVDSLGLHVIGGILSPTVADLYSHGRKGELQAVFTAATRWVAHLTIPLIVFCALKSPSVLGLFGASFTAGAVALRVGYVGQALNASAGHTRNVLAMTGKQWTLVAVQVVAMSVNLTLSWVLVRVLGWGVVGFAAAASVSVALTALLPLLLVWRFYGLHTYSARSARPILLAVLATPVLLWQLKPVWLDIAVGFVLYFVSYIVLNLVVGIEEEDRALLRQARQRLRQMGRVRRQPPAGP